ncbi:MAG: class I SAM-dependent methyltransferase [Vicinamibacterales bacterium]
MAAPDRQYEDYAHYLRGRSAVAWFYRRYWLYPRLSRHLHGQVLDVGSGIGDFVAFRPGTIGVDVNPVAVEWCRKSGLEVRLMQPDVLPFGDRAFQGVVLDNVLEHLSEPHALLHEIARVTSPGATLIVGVPGQRGYAADPDHKVFYDQVRLVSTVSAAGFSFHRLLHAPIRFAWLERRLPQYCLYGVFHRAGN